MKNYAKVKLRNIDNNQIVTEYRGHFIRKYLTDERPLFVLINTSPQGSEYFVDAKHFNTWWGAKRYMNRIFEKPRTLSTFYT